MGQMYRYGQIMVRWLRAFISVKKVMDGIALKIIVQENIWM